MDNLNHFYEEGEKLRHEGLKDGRESGIVFGYILGVIIVIGVCIGTEYDGRQDTGFISLCIWGAYISVFLGLLLTLTQQNMNLTELQRNRGIKELKYRGKEQVLTGWLCLTLSLALAYCAVILNLGLQGGIYLNIFSFIPYLLFVIWRIYRIST